jgi:2-keto-4-pentenoate hydratase/2-oxohepta-3-ene-1,7-dioic acid hydratase in catechol pathway
MRLVTYTHRGTTRLGALSGDGLIVDLARAAALTGNTLFPSTMEDLLRAGAAGLAAARNALATGEQAVRSDRGQAWEKGLFFELGEAGLRLEAPVQKPGAIYAIGLNYQAHRDESTTGRDAVPEAPKHPTVFTKARTALTGQGQPVVVPRASAMVDWEGELCVVIGSRAQRVRAADALGHVAGYSIGNDVSVRDWQFHNATWVAGKGFDTHAPMGPALVTADEVTDAGKLGLKTWVNGVLKQDACTEDLIFTVPVLIEYLSTAFTLEPGDIIFTGTPAGVGAAMKPPEFLKAGDTVKVAIDGLGELENPVTAEA